MNRISLPLLEFSTLAVVLFGCVVAVVPGADQYVLALLDGRNPQRIDKMNRVADVAPELVVPENENPIELPDRYASLDPTTGTAERQPDLALENLAQPPIDQWTANVEPSEQELLSLSPASDVGPDTAAIQPLEFDNEDFEIEPQENDGDASEFEDLEASPQATNESPGPGPVQPNSPQETTPDVQPKKPDTPIKELVHEAFNGTWITNQNHFDGWQTESVFSDRQRADFAKIIRNPLFETTADDIANSFGGTGKRLGGGSRILNEFFAAVTSNEANRKSISNFPTEIASEVIQNLPPQQSPPNPNEIIDAPVERKPMSASSMQSEIYNDFPMRYPAR